MSGLAKEQDIHSVKQLISLNTQMCRTVNGSVEMYFVFLNCSILQLTDMNEQEDLLLQHFVELPQLKQVISDKDNLVKSIEKLASKPS